MLKREIEKQLQEFPLIGTEKQFTHTHTHTHTYTYIPTYIYIYMLQMTILVAF